MGPNNGAHDFVMLQNFQCVIEAERSAGLILRSGRRRSQSHWRPFDARYTRRLLLHRDPGVEGTVVSVERRREVRSVYPGELMLS